MLLPPPSCLQHRQDCSSAAVLSWLEALLGIGEYYLASAVFHSARCFALQGGHLLLGKILDFLSVLGALLWTDAHFHGTGLSSHWSTHMTLSQPHGGSLLRTVAPSILFNLVTLCTIWQFADAGVPGDEVGGWTVSLASLRAWGVVRAVDTVLLTPCREELLYRGIVLGRLLRRLPSAELLCCCLSSSLFAAIHLKHAMDPRYGLAYTALQTALALAAGLLFGLQRVNQRSIWAPCICHVANNATASLLIAPSTSFRVAGGVMSAVTASVLFYAWRIWSELRLLRENLKKVT